VNILGVVAFLVEARQSHPRLLVGRRCMLWRVRLQNLRRQPSGFRFWHGQGLSSLTGGSDWVSVSDGRYKTTEPPVGHAVGIDMSLDGGLSNPTGDVILGIESALASGITELPCAPCVGVECAIGRGAQ
jgi:hypothetical protein